jgi:hypothetical protein
MALVVEVVVMEIAGPVEALTEGAVEEVEEDLVVETRMRLDLTVCLLVEHLVVRL